MKNKQPVYIQFLKSRPHLKETSEKCNIKALDKVFIIKNSQNIRKRKLHALKLAIVLKNQYIIQKNQMSFIFTIAYSYNPKSSRLPSERTTTDADIKTKKFARTILHPNTVKPNLDGHLRDFFKMSTDRATRIIEFILHTPITDMFSVSQVIKSTHTHILPIDLYTFGYAQYFTLIVSFLSSSRFIFLSTTTFLNDFIQ